MSEVEELEARIMNLPRQDLAKLRDWFLQLDVRPREEPTEPDTSDPLLEPRDEWERRLLGIGLNCGVSLSNEAVSSEGIYE